MLDITWRKKQGDRKNKVCGVNAFTAWWPSLLPCFDGARPPHPGAGTPAKIITTFSWSFSWSWSASWSSSSCSSWSWSSGSWWLWSSASPPWCRHASQNNHNFFVIIFVIMISVMIIIIMFIMIMIVRILMVMIIGISTLVVRQPISCWSS